MSKEKPMTAAEYREALRKLDLSQVSGATVLGITPRSSRRYASDRRVPTNIARTLRYLLKTKTAPADYLATLGIKAELTPYHETEYD